MPDEPEPEPIPANTFVVTLTADAYVTQGTAEQDAEDEGEPS